MVNSKTNMYLNSWTIKLIAIFIIVSITLSLTSATSRTKRRRAGLSTREVHLDQFSEDDIKEFQKMAKKHGLDVDNDRLYKMWYTGLG